MGWCDFLYSTVFLLNNFPCSFRQQLMKAKKKPGWTLAILTPEARATCVQAVLMHTKASEPWDQGGMCGLPQGCRQDRARDRSRNLWKRLLMAARAPESPFPCCALVCAPTLVMFFVLVATSPEKANCFVFICSLQCLVPLCLHTENSGRIPEKCQIMNAELGLKDREMSPLQIFLRLNHTTWSELTTTTKKGV